MLIAPVNNQQINLSTNSQTVNSIESNNTKKRFRASSSSNDENDNNRNFINNDLNSNNRMIGRKGIYGSKELTILKLELFLLMSMLAMYIWILRMKR